MPREKLSSEMGRLDETGAANRMKRNDSFGKFSGEENYTLSSNSNHVIQSLTTAKYVEPRKRATDVNEQPRQKWRSLFGELSMQQSGAAVKNGKIDSDGNMDRKPDDLMAREVERLHNLKLEVMRANDKRRRSYAAFGRQERQRRSSVLGGHFPSGLEIKGRSCDNKNEAPKRRRVTLTFPIENRHTLQLPQIQPLNFDKAKQSRRVRGANQNCKGVEKMLISVGESSDETAAKTKQDEHGQEAERMRYGSPLPGVNNKSFEEEHVRETSVGPQITVSDYVDLNLRVKTFVKKPQPQPSEMSLRVARRTMKVRPSIDSAAMTKKINTANEEAKHSKVVNTETCPSISFYEDRSWYYQDKRRKCRYLRVPDSPVPPIHSVFEKD